MFGKKKKECSNAQEYEAFRQELINVYGMTIGEGSRISRFAVLDKNTNPKGVFIGNHTWLMGTAMILAHDGCREIKMDVHIGDNCYIGQRTVIMPGVTIGDEVIVRPGSVVTKDVPSHSIVLGNPARVIQSNVHCGPFGKIISIDGE